MKNSKNYPRGWPGNLKILIQFSFSPILQIAALLAFIILSGCPESENTELGDQLSLLQLSEEQWLALDFAGADLLKSNSEPRAPRPYPKEVELSRLQKVVWPEFQTRGDKTCLISVPEFYFVNESGLRLAYCSRLLSRSKADLERLLKSYRSPETPGFQAEVQNSEFKFSLRSLEEIRSENFVGISMDGAPLQSVLRPAGLAGKFAAFESSRPLNRQTLKSGALPGRFPGMYFHLLLTERGLILLYPTERKDEFLSIELYLTQGRSRLWGAARELRRVQSRLLDSAREFSPHVSEIYFPSQGGKDKSFLEFTGDFNSNSLVFIQLGNDENQRFYRENFIFAGGVSLLSGAVFSFDLGFRLGEQEFLKEELKSGGLSPNRSLTFSKAGWGGASNCVRKEPCSHPGIHPQLLQRLKEEEDELPYCVPEDIQLSELNPFGLIQDLNSLGESSKTISSLGKFIEIKIKRGCRGGKILLLVDNITLDPGFARRKKGEIILFVASPDFFAYPGAIPSLALRSFQTESRIQVLNPVNGRRKTLYQGGLDGARLLPGNARFNLRQPRVSLRRLHSLVCESDLSCGLFHGPGGLGLRPDLSLTHAMSPGFESPMTPALMTDSNVQISEILPVGALDNEGKRYPEDEFIELEFDTPLNQPAIAPGRPGVLNLEIKTDAGEVYLYRFPWPQIEPDSRRFVLFRGRPFCFADRDEFLHRSELVLPNKPALYRLFDGHKNLLDEVYISPSLYAGLDREKRRSLNRIQSENIFRPSAGTASRAPFCERTSASPGEAEHFLPFLHFLSSGREFRRYRLYGNGGEKTLRITAGSATDTSGLEYIQSLSPGETLEIPLPQAPTYARFLIRVAGREDAVEYNGLEEEVFLKSPRLTFAAISAVPGPGHHEWIRLCSPAGFRPEQAPGGIFLQDENDKDRIVPWSNRSSMTPPPGLGGHSLELAPGQCAILADPDFNGHALPRIPQDTRLWTTASGAGLGDGLRAGEGLRLILRDGLGRDFTLASFGRPDLPNSSFAPESHSGQYLLRQDGEFLDLPEYFQTVFELNSGGTP